MHEEKTKTKRTTEQIKSKGNREGDSERKGKKRKRKNTIHSKS